MEAFWKEKMEKNQTKYSFQNIISTVDALQVCSSNIDAEKADTEGRMSDFLADVTEAEIAGITLDVVKMNVYDVKQWNYKIDDASTGSTRSVNFGKESKAPSVVAVLFSQGKKYNSKGYNFVDATCWQDVITGGKNEDPLIALRDACKALIKEAKGVSPTEVEYLAGQINANREALVDRKNGLRIAA